MEGVELEKGKAVEDHESVEREERSNLDYLLTHDISHCEIVAAG